MRMRWLRRLCVSRALCATSLHKSPPQLPEFDTLCAECFDGGMHSEQAVWLVRTLGAAVLYPSCCCCIERPN